MRVVLDTNVLISAFLWQGRPKGIFSLAEKSALRICVTEELVEEFERVLLYPKFKTRLAQINKSPSQVINEFLEVAQYYPAIRFSRVQVKDDPADDKFLSCAASAGADFIISGDRHLLKLKKFTNIPILTPAQFLKRFRKK